MCFGDTALLTCLQVLMPLSGTARSAQHGVFDYMEEGFVLLCQVHLLGPNKSFSWQVMLSLRNAISKAASPKSAYLMTKTSVHDSTPERRSLATQPRLTLVFWLDDVSFAKLCRLLSLSLELFCFCDFWYEVFILGAETLHF